MAALNKTIGNTSFKSNGCKSPKAIVHFVLGAALLLSACSQSAHAQGVRIPKNALQKAEWYRAPLSIQVTDDRPTVRYFPKAESNDSVLIDPTLPRAAASGSAPSSVNVLRSNLPQAGFGSNISSPRTLLPRNLPDGHSSNLLAGRMAQPQSLPQPNQSSSRKSLLSHAPLPTASGPSILQYTDSAPVTGSSSLLTKTHVNGILLRSAR
jgi:hypothetical protein